MNFINYQHKVKGILGAVLNYTLTTKVKKVIFAGCLITTFFAVFALNLQHPLFTDDWEYAFIERLYDCENKSFTSNNKISSISDIFRSQYDHYFAWGGRSVNHSIAQFLLMIGTPFNKILNAMAYVLFTYIIYILTKKKTDHLKVSSFLLINILIFFFQPVFGFTIIWITGSSNYLWAALIVLLFLVPYKNLFEENNRYNSIIKTFFLFPAGIIAGWTNENIAAAVIFLLICFYLYRRIKKQIIPVWFYTGFFGFLTGFILMIAAPGNYVRYAETLEIKGQTHLSQIQILFGQFTTASSVIFFYLSGITSVCMILLVLYRNQRTDFKEIVFSVSFFITAILATLAMTFSPVFPERALFGIIIFIIISIVRIYNNIDFKIKLYRELKVLTLTLAVISMTGYYISGYKDLAKANGIFQKREKFIVEQKEKGIMDLVFEKEITSKSRINNLYDLTENPEYWTNCFYARYYGINSVIVKTPDK